MDSLCQTTVLLMFAGVGRFTGYVELAGDGLVRAGAAGEGAAAGEAVGSGAATTTDKARQAVSTGWTERTAGTKANSGTVALETLSAAGLGAVIEIEER